MPTTRLSHRRIARPGAALTLSLSAAVLVACSGGADPSSAPGTSASTDAPSPSASAGAPGSTEASPEAPSSSVLQATETDFAIELSKTELAAGTHTIEVVNEGGATHDLVVENADGEDVAASEVIPPGGSGTVEVDLQPGEYVVYCSIANHRGMGMELAVTVV
ncbi:cupredoxin domain-containing protein [Geodermatophilus chilensis]|uniref:cupredoxin domain-containing protein n=1 Tax=Geodermatophilus chilensis TaxID=2035835 RepID=UPI0012FFD46B|nr:cupredoxin domain-containing protein [Geodermatophilus chilensis]